MTSPCQTPSSSYDSSYSTHAKNPFFLYHRDALISGAISTTFVDSHGQLRHKEQVDVLKEASDMWKSAPEEMRVLYRVLTEMEGGEGQVSEPEDHLIAETFDALPVIVDPNVEVLASYNEGLCPASSVDENVVAFRTSSIDTTSMPISQSSSALHQAKVVKLPAPPKASKIPRPANAFILYRRDALGSGAVNTKVKSDCGEERQRTQSEMSKEIALLWKNAPNGVKSHYHALAIERKKEHKEKYPDYKFTPRMKIPRASARSNSSFAESPKPEIGGCACGHAAHSAGRYRYYCYR